MTGSDDRLPAELARRNWIILAVLVLLSLGWRSWPVTAGVAAGGLVVCLNYHFLGRSLTRLLLEQEASARGKWTSARNTLVRLVLTLAVIYVLLVHTAIHPLAFGAGLSVYVLNLLLTTLRRLY